MPFHQEEASLYPAQINGVRALGATFTLKFDVNDWTPVN